MEPVVSTQILETFSHLYSNMPICEEIANHYDIEGQLRVFLLKYFNITLRHDVELYVSYWTAPHPLLVITCDQFSSNPNKMSMRIDIDGLTGHLKSINEPNNYGRLLYSDDIQLVNIIADRRGNIIDHNLRMAE